jgi:NAD(P)-dependent dehydrogenase (short-subunit alcohol dehydrogenase family)
MEGTQAMAGRLDGKVALILGAGASAPGWGIGRAVTALYVREGARVMGVDIAADSLDETRRVIEAEGGTLETTLADATDPASLAAARDRCLERFGRIDILQHNVGRGGPGGILDTTDAAWRAGIELNLGSAFYAARAVLPAMIAAGGGVLTFISSIAGVRPVRGSSVAYHAAKAGLIQLSRVIALDHAADGIRANCILPGYVDTPEIRTRLGRRFGDDIMQLRANTVPSRRAATVWDIAHAAVFLSSEQAGHVSGTELMVDGTQGLQSAPPYLPEK